MAWVDCCKCGRAEPHVLCHECEQRKRGELTHTDANVATLHSAAMGLAHTAQDIYAQAGSLEMQAAKKIELKEENEPTRSVLYRSAANLMWLGGNNRYAEELALEGLRGFPSPYEVEKLNEILAQARKSLQS